MMIRVEDGAGRQFSCESYEFSSSTSRRLRELGFVKAYLCEESQDEVLVSDSDYEIFVKSVQLLAVIANDTTSHLGKLCIIKKEI